MLVLAFVGLLGGTHPSDSTRDRALLIAALVIAALHTPLLLWLARQLRRRDRVPLAVPFGLVLRLGAAGLVLSFIHGISHERPRFVDWRLHGAWRHCGAAIALWPRGPALDCAAAHLCANEAPLDAAERQKLAAITRELPDCPPP